MARPNAMERLARLLAVVPWVVARDGPKVSEVCERFAISESELLADLNLLFLCGVYPFTPDALIEVDIDGGRVWIRFADWFRRPMRLTPPEGLALVAAARGLLSVPGGQGPLASAVAKLEMVLGAGSEDALDVELGEASSQVLDTLRHASADHRKVLVDYYSFGRDETGTRVIQPWRLFSSEGRWYLSAWCEKAEDKRLFRVDRVHSVSVLDDRFEPPAELSTPPLYEGRPGDMLVVLDLAPAAHWVAEQYPNEGAERVAADGRGQVLRVSLRASSRAWLERLLLRAGTDATVVSGGQGMAEGAARRLLALYARTVAEEPGM